MEADQDTKFVFQLSIIYGATFESRRFPPVAGIARIALLIIKGRRFKRHVFGEKNVERLNIPGTKQQDLSTATTPLL